MPYIIQTDNYFYLTGRSNYFQFQLRDRKTWKVLIAVIEKKRYDKYIEFLPNFRGCFMAKDPVQYIFSNCKTKSYDL